MNIARIREHRENQVAFGRYLLTCASCTGEREVLSAIHALARYEIEGLGPTAANLLYFLHPTILAPFNTALVKGYNALCGAKLKARPLGRVSRYAREDSRSQWTVS